MFNLHFVGRGAAFNPVQGNTNAWFIRKTHLVLLDCGENAFAMVHDFPGLLGWDSITVLITHLHADHAGSLATLCSYCYFVLRQKVLVVHPLSSVTQLLSMQGVDKGVYNYVASLPSGFGFEAKALLMNYAILMKPSITAGIALIFL
jgi:ribonuclease BN (tRNA processing enzyme)